MTPPTTDTQTWTDLGAVPPADLVGARLEAHWTAQIASAFGTTLLTRAPDDSHTSLEWLDGHGALASQAARGARAGLRIADLTLLVVRGDDVEADHPLEGQTIEDGLGWLSDVAARVSGEAQHLAWGDYDLPERKGGASGPVAVDRAALGELARWYSCADSILRGLVARTENASAVRCWPHHFDIATLISLGPGEGGKEPRTVGVGMTPGDSSYAEPYFYVTPWPYPASQKPSALAAGHWHSEGWFGAVLTGTELLDRRTERRALVSEFVHQAVSVARDIAGE